MAQRPQFAGWLSDTNDVTATFLAAGQIPGLINLGGGLPEPSTYPAAELSALAGRAIEEHPHATLNYPPIDGLPALRDLLAKRFTTDTLHLTRDNVIITSGGMQALDLVGKVLVDAGQTITCQSPAYLGAIDAWKPRLPSYRPIKLEDDNLDLTAAFTGAQFAYTVPNFSNPSGRLVSLEQRKAIVDAAHATGTWLVEDDPYGSLYLYGEPLPRLLDLSAAQKPGPYDGPIIYMGTFSKEVAPGLRIGWIIAAPELIAALKTAKQGSDMCSSGLSQQVVIGAFEQGLPEKILPNVLATYRARRDALLEAMDEHLAPFYEWERPVGGMFVWARARDPMLDTNALLKEGLSHGVCISPSSVFDPEGTDRGGVRINFTLNTEDKLREGARRLAIATASLISKHRQAA